MKAYCTILILSVVFFCACSKPEVNKKIVLKAGNLEVTQYEFERNKTRELDAALSKNNSKTDAEKTANWKKEYFERVLIVADALEKRYDTLSSIQKTLETVGDIMMVQKYGYLWQETVSPIVDAFKEVTDEKAEKRKKLFYFDYIECTNLSSLLEITNNDTIVPNKEAFLKLKNRIHTNPSFTSGYYSSQWPFGNLYNYNDYLYEMKEGTVSKRMNINGSYIYVYLDHMETIELTPQDKEGLRSELQYIKEAELVEKMNAEINANCNPKIDTAHVDSLIQFIAEGNTLMQFEKELELLQFTVDNTLKKAGTADFIKYYSNQLMRTDIKTKDDLLGYIAQYYRDDYNKSKAKKMDLYHSDIFLLDRKNFQNNIMYGQYMENEVAKGIKVDSLEIVAYYNQNLALFEQPQKITVSLFAFQNSGDAMNNQYAISEIIKRNDLAKIKDTNEVKGLIEYTSNFTVDLNDEGYSNEFLRTLENTPLGTLSNSPVEYKNQQVLLFKEKEEGKTTKKLGLVYKQIEYQLTNEKIEKQKQIVVKKLRGKYKIEIDKTGI